MQKYANIRACLFIDKNSEDEGYNTVDVKKENIQKSKPHLKFFVKYSEDEGYNRCKKRENIQISKPHHNFFLLFYEKTF